jgi:hypothetical protein
VLSLLSRVNDVEPAGATMASPSLAREPSSQDRTTGVTSTLRNRLALEAPTGIPETVAGPVAGAVAAVRASSVQAPATGSTSKAPGAATFPIQIRSAARATSDPVVPAGSVAKSNLR